MVTATITAKMRSAPKSAAKGSKKPTPYKQITVPNPMREENIKKIRAACIKANPEILGRRPEIKVQPNRDELYTSAPFGHRIGIADIFLAVHRTKVGNGWEPIGNWPGDLVGYTFDYQGGVICEPIWNLRKDNLEEQSDETLSFIATLLT